MPVTMTPASISFDAGITPVTDRFNDVYFAKGQGLEESTYVFLEANELPKRLSAYKQSSGVERPFVVAETGFGTGLNVLNLIKLWQSIPVGNPQATLHILSVEKFPLKKADVEKALQVWPELSSASENLLNQYPPLIEGNYQLHFNGNVKLTLLFNDVLSGFSSLLPIPSQAWFKSPNQCVDAWMLDGFAPAKNPDMWSQDLFNLMAQMSHTGTTLATFTAAGFVKRGLQSAGFQTNKQKGFGKKRDMLTGMFKGLPSSKALPPKKHNAKDKPQFWPITPCIRPPRKIGILGAGVAGSIAAAVLAKAGFEITLIDRSEKALAGAHQQAVLFPAFSVQDSFLTRFHFYAFVQALAFYQQYFPNALHRSPLLQLIESGHEKKAQLIADRFNNDELIRLITATEASQWANTELHLSALLYPTSGWIDPQKLRLGLTRYPIQYCLGETVEAIHYDDDWHIQTRTQQLSFDGLVIAAGDNSERLLQQIDPNLALNMGSIRGQVTHIDQKGLPYLSSIVCHEGYICPSTQTGDYSLGATYDLNNRNPELEQQAQQKNLTSLAKHLPEFQHLTKQTLDTRGSVGFRATTRDYLPVIGPVPASKSLIEKYKPLRHNKNAYIPIINDYHPHLYLLSGFGSKGYTSAPMATKMLLSYLTNDFQPLGADLIRATHPARFLIKRLIQNKA